MWTDEQRKAHKPRVGRYPSDVTDEEWAIIEPMIPPARTGGRKRQTDVREVFNAIRYVDRTGCQWRQLPKDFPQHTTVYNYFLGMDALRHARSYSSNAHGEMPRSLRAPERPDSGNHRHAGCESDRKRCYGASGDDIASIGKLLNKRWLHRRR